jgi:hypothetical protein
MLYVTRSRPKETVGPEQLVEINRLLDTELFPAFRNVQGVRSIQAYNSINGDLVVLIDIENLSTIDRALADCGVAPVTRKLTSLLVRIGGEVLYDRPAWQGLYGMSEP